MVKNYLKRAHFLSFNVKRKFEDENGKKFDPKVESNLRLSAMPTFIVTFVAKRFHFWLKEQKH